MILDEPRDRGKQKCENPKVEGSIASRQNRGREWPECGDWEAWYKT